MDRLKLWLRGEFIEFSKKIDGEVRMKRGSQFITVILISALVVMGISTLGITQKPYAGTKLKLFTMTGPFISGPPKMHRPEWEKKTGGKIDVIEGPYAELYPKIMQAAAVRLPLYDILLVGNVWVADLVRAKYVIPLDKYIENPKTDPGWDDVPEGIKRKNTWGGKVYSVICDNDNQFLFYRKDILSNPEYQAKFKVKYGYDLPVPPRTLDQLIDVAEFFTGWDWDNDGEIEYGFIHSCMRGAQTYNYAYSWPSPYTVIPSPPAPAPGILFFDSDNMKPLVNSPGWIRGIEQFIEINKRGCPGGLSWVRADVIEEFILGRVAMAIDWGDIGTTAHAPRSLVKGKVGYALPPGSTEYWDREKNTWVKLPAGEVHYAPVHAFNGWAWYITTTCKDPDAAWDFIRFMISPEISAFDVAMADSGYQPWRISHSVKLDPWEKAGWDREDARAYIRTILDATDHPNAVIDTRIPAAGRYQEEFEFYLTRALAGEVTVKEAMDACYEAWEKITESVGRDILLEAYRAHLGL